MHRDIAPNLNQFIIYFPLTVKERTTPIRCIGLDTSALWMYQIVSDYSWFWQWKLQGWGCIQAESNPNWSCVAHAGKATYMFAYVSFLLSKQNMYFLVCVVVFAVNIICIYFIVCSSYSQSYGCIFQCAVKVICIYLCMWVRTAKLYFLVSSSYSQSYRCISQCTLPAVKVTCILCWYVVPTVNTSGVWHCVSVRFM